MDRARGARASGTQMLSRVVLAAEPLPRRTGKWVKERRARPGRSVPSVMTRACSIRPSQVPSSTDRRGKHLLEDEKLARLSPQ